MSALFNLKFPARHSKTQILAGHPQLFSPEEEEAMLVHINAMSKWEFPCDLLDLRFIAKQYLDKCGRRELILKDNLPRKDWALNFMKRHKSQMSHLLRSNISSKRATESCEVIDFF